MSLVIKTSFLANASKDQVWSLITDIEKSAPCFPGAVLGEKLPDGFYQGGFNVKLGPMTFNFAGKFGFVEQDEINHHAKISASGTDTKGRGGAQGLIDVQLTENNQQTEVQIISDVNLSGSVAQYGRGVGMIQAISQQLINDFGKNLSTMIVQDPLPHSSDPLMKESADGNMSQIHPTQNSIQVHQIIWRTFLTWVKGLFLKKS